VALDEQTPAWLVSDPGTLLPADRLAKVERDMERLREGLALLDVKPCSCCGKFYRSSTGALFDSGTPVCFACLPQWWPLHSPGMGAAERQKTEMALTRWVLSHHHAEVIRRPEDLPDPEHLRLKLVVGCEQCQGSGKDFSGNKLCPRCDGRGTLWLISRKPNSWQSP
jgi:hypothetical protein